LAVEQLERGCLELVVHSPADCALGPPSTGIGLGVGWAPFDGPLALAATLPDERPEVLRRRDRGDTRSSSMSVFDDFSRRPFKE